MQMINVKIYVNSCHYTLLKFRKSFLLKVMVPATLKRHLKENLLVFILKFRLYLLESTRTYYN